MSLFYGPFSVLFISSVSFSLSMDGMSEKPSDFVLVFFYDDEDAKPTISPDIDIDQLFRPMVLRKG